ncbi:bifunctional helix-turn-helix transcriptional regulator/GNAT family N-acetyltransferase [Sedimenticola hydrogenitrophicus]|uniref:bifunctional helix-turn-helix transcriptional regulator/GNAT family N-acetyltransferase n=1 Tax=Sedimenticola hydrogenitrophicus TaxID=2967975 RepID=UPI0021A4D5DD|nr:bifunctional helix-turn-helix transcriptional regulator/GNAT family N-acetyltransferase [Sedimenticola hydrogenitrophicus]
MSSDQAADRIDRIRVFNRFYTRQIGILDECFLGEPYSLPEIRVLFEVARDSRTTATTLAEYLRMDPGYVSRILAKLLERGLLQRDADPGDRRRKQLTLTPRGQAQLKSLDGLARESMQHLLKSLSPDQQDELITAMERIRHLLESDVRHASLIRPLKLGDLGTVINRHAVLYAMEYGWDQSFERTVLEVLSAFASNYDPQRERGWVAEVDGQFAGSIFAVKEDETTARLRALLVEPRFRGLQLGRRLIEQCVDFCRQAGYRRITLWTCADLTQARKLYTKAGFSCSRAWQEKPFGTEIISESWDMEL